MVDYINHALLDGLLPSASLCLFNFPQPPHAAPVTGAQVFKHISFNYHRKFLVFPVFLLITYILKHCLASFLFPIIPQRLFFVIILKFSIYWNLTKVLTHLVPLCGRLSFLFTCVSVSWMYVFTCVYVLSEPPPHPALNKKVLPQACLQNGMPDTCSQ